MNCFVVPLGYRQLGAKLQAEVSGILNWALAGLKQYRPRVRRLFWIAFYLLFGFWLASYFLHLRGGLTTHSLALVSIILFVKALRA
jgi:hypothetical protein